MVISELASSIGSNSAASAIHRMADANDDGRLSFDEYFAMFEAQLDVLLASDENYGMIVHSMTSGQRGDASYLGATAS